MSISRLLAAGVALTTGGVALAQDYFDFGPIPGLPEEPAVRLDLDPTMLGIAAAAARSSDPGVAELLSSVEGVRVRIYKGLEAIDDVAAAIDEISVQLEQAGWQQVIRVQDDDKIRVYVREDQESVTGITGIVLSGSEAIFVNMAGTISPEQLAQLMADMGAIEMLASAGGRGVAN